MFLLLKSLSRSVHDEQHQHQPEFSETQGNAGGVICTSLTVWRKSLLVSCTGFTVIDCTGNLVYRVDNYMGRRPKELILMDAKGTSILTMKRCKNLGLTHNWVIYRGEVGDYYCTSVVSEKPIFYVKKCMNILHTNPNVLAYVYHRSSDKRYTYTIEGSYSHRSCKVVDEKKRVVAEIKRKAAMSGGISFGLDVFMLIIKAGFDPGFAMALVLLLDQMFT
ncbi:Protein LURP-one-related 17 [Hibiscus syriacus]|uniref:Protein LURP-one-related 17 n=1 Tax=Hibiscus syriacus TaxID=106335 RepID=A0A6A2YHY5_HIBSY|nr:protein LURP-one-related 17-like [Hibiscus syriacus]KAE8675727.1 Protein LURP-one-related 17 [Hibiscus syriacus]